MRGILRAVVKTLTVLAFVTGAVFAVSAQTSNKTSVSVHLVAYVPPVLKLSLNFSTDGFARVNGYLGDSSPKDGFELKSNSTFTLGAARIVSNLGSSYSIVVQSMNNGKLKNQESGNEIHYDLLIGGVPTARYGDAFRMVSAIRTSGAGMDLPVSIALGNIPSGASFGLYSDNLLFNVMAN